MALVWAVQRGVGVDASLWLGVGMCAGALGVGERWPALAFVLGAIALFLARRRWLWAVVLALGFAGGWLRPVRAAVTPPGSWPARCEVTGVVARSPVMLGDGLRVELEARRIACDGAERGPGRVAMQVASGSVARGDEVEVFGSLAPPYAFRNEGGRLGAAARRGVVLSGGADALVVVRRGSGLLAFVDRLRAHTRDRILATFPHETSPMARALVLGEEDLGAEDTQAFRRSGLAHLLAVSGMHLVLVVMGFVAALRKLLARTPLAAWVDVGRVAAAIGLPLAWLYAELAGGSGSAIRAAWMCSVVLSARALGRRPSVWRSLGLSIALMSALDAQVAYDVSFVLSALATLGLVALARPIATRLAWAGRAATPLATTAAATIACAPVIATIAPELPLAGLVANVVAVPIGEAAALPLCLVHGLLSPWPAAERGCALAASGALVLVRMAARGFAWGALPVPSPTSWQLSVMATCAVGLAVGLGRAWAAAAASVLAGLELAVRLRGAPHDVLRVTFLDVGQGDAALVDLPDGSSMLVDGGGLVGSPVDVGARAILPLLAARRRSSLALVVLSHPHPDHWLGLPSVLERTRTEAFWDTGQSVESAPLAAFLEGLRARGVAVRAPACGPHALGGAVVEVLAPCPAYDPDRGPNDNSFVLRVTFGTRAILFVGDAERAEEQGLVARDVRADVLKVGHHGSRTSSSPAFVDAVRPSLAVISSGVRNRFGHPHAETLATFAERGIRVLRTDRDGAVVVTTDGRELAVQ